MNSRKNIPDLVKTLLGNKSKNWVAVYIDLLKLMDNVIKIRIENKALVISSLVEALSGYLFSNSQLNGEIKTIFNRKWYRYRKRNSLFNPYRTDDIENLFEDWLERVHSLLSNSLENSSALEMFQSDADRTEANSKKRRKLSLTKSHLETRLAAYSDSYGLIYLDIVELVCNKVLCSSTRNIAIAGLLRAFKGILNSAAELIQPGAGLKSKEEDGEKRKKTIIKNATSLSDESVEIIFNSDIHSYQHGNQLDVNECFFTTEWLHQFENALSKLLDSLEEFYIQAQERITSIIKKNKLTNVDIEILKDLFQSRNLLTYFLNASSAENLIETLAKDHFFDFPHRTGNRVSYPYNDLYPQSRIFRERAVNEPQAVVKVICNWPKDVDERIISDSLAALEKIPEKFTLQVLPKVLEWAKQHQLNNHFLSNLLDFLCNLTNLKLQDASTIAVYSILIRLILKSLVNASRYDVQGKIRYFQAPHISSENIEKLISLAYSNLGTPFLSWFLTLCKRMWDYDNPTLNTILQIWVPNFSTDYRESILGNYDALFLLYYCDQMYEAVKNAQYPNRLISSLARRKNPICIRIAYEIAIRLMKNHSTLLSFQTISKLACNSNLFFESSGNAEYRHFVFLAWPYLQLNSRQTLKKWWNDSLSQSARFNWLTNNSGIIPKEFQEDYENLLAIHEAEIEKLSYKWSPQSDQTIEEWIAQAEKAIMYDHHNFSLLGNVEKIIEQLEEDIVRRPFLYLTKSIVWIRSKGEIIDAILTKINIGLLQNHSDEFASYLSELENVIEDSATQELWPHVNFFLRSSQHYPSSIPLQSQETFLSVQWALFRRVMGSIKKRNLQIKFDDTLNKQSVNTVHGKALEAILNYTFIYSPDKTLALGKLEANFDYLLKCTEIPEIAYFLGEYLPHFVASTPKIGSQLITRMTQKDGQRLNLKQLNLWNGFAYARFLLSQDLGKTLLKGYLQLCEENLGGVFLPIAQNQPILRLWSNFFHWCRVSKVDPDDPLFINLVKTCKREIIIVVVERFSRFIGDLEFNEDLMDQAKREQACAFFHAMLNVIIAHHGPLILSKFGWSFKNGFIGTASLTLLQLALKNKVIVEPVWLIFEALEEHSKHDAETASGIVLDILKEYSSAELRLAKQQLESCINAFKDRGIATPKLNTIKGLQLRKFGLQ